MLEKRRFARCASHNVDLAVAGRFAVDQAMRKDHRWRKLGLILSRAVDGKMAPDWTRQASLSNAAVELRGSLIR